MKGPGRNAAERCGRGHRNQLRNRASGSPACFVQRSPQHRPAAAVSKQRTYCCTCSEAVVSASVITATDAAGTLKLDKAVDHVHCRAARSQQARSDKSHHCWSTQECKVSAQVLYATLVRQRHATATLDTAHLKAATSSVSDGHRPSAN